MSVSNSGSGGNRRRSSRGGGSRARRSSADGATTSAPASKAQRERGARTGTTSVGSGSRTVSRASAASSRGAALPQISRNEVIGRLLLALAVAMAFVTVFSSLVTGGVVVMLVIPTIALGIIGATLFALGRFRE